MMKHGCVTMLIKQSLFPVFCGTPTQDIIALQ